MHALPSEGNIITFAYYHPECFTFPTPYIEALARLGKRALYVEWPRGVRAQYPYGHRSEKTIRIVPLEKIGRIPQWGRVCCEECWEFLHPEKVEEKAS
jgi:hypothetical protein